MGGGRQYVLGPPGLKGVGPEPLGPGSPLSALMSVLKPESTSAATHRIILPASASLDCHLVPESFISSTKIQMGYEAC